MIKRVGSLYTSESLPGKFYLTRKEILSALEDEDFTNSEEILEDYVKNQQEERLEKLRHIGPEKLYLHAKDMGKRYPEAEPIILESPEWTYKYIYHVINKDKTKDPIRWKEGEEVLAKDPKYAFSYAWAVLNMNKYKGNMDRWPEGEAAILTSSEASYKYAKEIIDGIWKEGEKTIFKDPYWAYKYVYDVVNYYNSDENKKRYPEAEPAICRIPEYAYSYAFSIINAGRKEGNRIRWPEGEKIIMQDPRYAVYYVEDIIRDKWPEAEPYIFQSKEWSDKYRFILRKLGKNEKASEIGDMKNI